MGSALPFQLGVGLAMVLMLMVTHTQTQVLPEHPTRITIPPLDHKVPAHTRVTFFCKASGHPAPIVTWWKNNKELFVRRNRYITQTAYTSTLTLESATSKQSGLYQCRADNEVGEQSVANATLFVYAAGEALPEGYPVVTEATNRTITLIERGFPMTLRCTISGEPSPEVIWYKSKIPVDSRSSNRIQVVNRPDAPGSHDLRLLTTKSEDQGDYVCMGRNIHGTIYSNEMKVFIKVRSYAPEFTIRPDPVYNVMAGTALNLTCVAVGSPMPYVIWSRDDTRLTDTGSAPIGKNVLRLVDIQQSAHYNCTAQSGLGTIMVTTEVRVQALPEAPEQLWLTDITSISAMVSWTTARQQAGPISTADPEYVVQYRTFYGGKANEEWSEQGEGTIATSLAYKLSGLQPYTLYDVRVVPYIEYGRGNPSKTLQLQTMAAAPGSAPHEVKAKAVSDTTALIQWQRPLQPNGEIVGYNVLYILSANAEQPKESWMLLPATNTLAVLNDLTRDEDYSVSVQARNRIGTGPYSTPIRFTMKKGVPLAPTNLQVTAITSNSLTLSWERPQDADSILSYEIYINNSRNRQPVGENIEAEVLSVVPPQESYILEDLFPNTFYNIRVTARSTTGEGPHSVTIQKKTLEAEPSAPPLIIQAKAPKPDASEQLKVEWAPPSAVQANGDITGFKLFYVINSGDDSAATELHIDEPSQTSIVIDGLQVWTEYRVWMKASTRVGDSPPSQPVVARTGQDVPNAPRMFAVLALNSSAVLIQWRKPNEREARGEIRGYQLYQSEWRNGQRSGESKVIMVVDGDAQNYTTTGLKARQEYVFQMRAFTQAGDGVATAAKNVITLGAVPTAPRNLNLEIVDEDPPRVRVTFDPPHDAHGQLRSYRLMWGKRDDSVLSNTASISHSMDNYVADRMMKGTEYEFRLQALNEENYGEAAVDFIRTEDGVPSGSPQTITAMFETHTSALVSWQELDPGLRNGIIIMYQVRYRDQYDAVDLRAVNTSETSVVIDDLTPGSKYFIQVVAFTSAGAGPTSHRVAYDPTQSSLQPPLSVSGRRVEPTTIEVSWQSPIVAVTGYKIHYTTRDMGEGVDNWLMVESNQPTPNYRLTNLDATRAYAIRVQAVNADGDTSANSEEAIVNKVIPEGTPPPPDSRVRKLTSSRQTATAITLNWNAPSKEGATNYRIRYRGISASGKVHEGEFRTISAVSYNNEKNIDGLKPAHLYKFEVLVSFPPDNDYVGMRSLDVSTKAVAAPKLKKSTNFAQIDLTRDQNDFDIIYIIVALNSESRPPPDINLAELQERKIQRRSIAAEDGPYIAGSFPIAPNNFTIGDNLYYGDYHNKELKPGAQYKAFVRVLVEGDEFSSDYTSPFTSSGPVAEPIVEDPKPRPESDKVALILGPIGSVIVMSVIIVIIVVVIRRNKTHKKEKAPEPTKIVIDQPPVYPNDPVELRRMQFSTPGMQNHPPIPILQLSGHIDLLRAHDNLKFSQEYESIEPGQQFTWDNSNLEYNKPKNRYANVIAYDHSRVVLQPVDGIPGSDYINANYMDGYRKQNAYISTQGALPETFGDFWRMVWEQRSATIVMMTKLEERARVKCDTYWPSEGTEMYGPIIVTLTDCMELATYTVRTFQIERDGWAEKREVRQFQFTAWPDHGVPDYPTPLLIFMRRVKAATPSDSGPMVVHCSAGVGRTGAFIVIDAMLERIKHEKTVDIYGHVTCLRAQRNYMVQTEDQYIFIHDALLEAVLSGNTEIPARNLYTHIQKLTQPDGAATGMEKEFKTLSNAKINPARFASANLAVNKFKNRLVNVLPYESNRVCLQPIRGVDGSDYVNASFIDGYRFKKAYIATQGPLAETAEDFWRMIWEHNSTIVVMLTKTREMGREKCHQYWPEERSARYQYFVVDPHAEYSMSEYTLREFKVTDARDGQSRTVRLFMFNEWPEQGIPKSGMSFIQFIGQVHKTKEQFGQEGPITVHCSAGVGRTGVFISLSIILERMRYEGVVDMFQTVKMLRTQRQGMVQTEEQYAFCYQAALEHLASFDHY